MTSLSAGLTDETRKNLFGDADLNMLWSCVGDPRFCYWVHVPTSYNEDSETYGLMVIVHGTGCATENYVREARAGVMPIMWRSWPRCSRAALSITVISMPTSC